MKPNKIILHHSLTQDSSTVSWGAIRDFHTLTLRWNDIGYHFGIENLRGQTEILMGRMPYVQGAHCKGYNRNSIGICFVGNYDLEPVPEEHWKCGLRLVKYLQSVYSITTILGHRELNPAKSCPGKLFDLTKFRADINKLSGINPAHI